MNRKFTPRLHISQITVVSATRAHTHKHRWSFQPRQEHKSRSPLDKKIGGKTNFRLRFTLPKTCSKLHTSFGGFSLENGNLLTLPSRLQTTLQGLAREEIGVKEKLILWTIQYLFSFSVFVFLEITFFVLLCFADTSYKIMEAPSPKPEN